MLMKMLADMMGMSPETMQSEMEGFASLAKESHAALARIEDDQKTILRELREMKEAQANDRHDDHGSSPGS